MGLTARILALATAASIGGALLGPPAHAATPDPTAPSSGPPSVLTEQQATSILLDSSDLGSSYTEDNSSTPAGEPTCLDVNAPHLVALVRNGAVFKKGKLVERSTARGLTETAA